VSDFWNEMECEALYRIPIEELNLDLGTAWALARTGVTSIGDCIDLLLRFDAGIISHFSGYGLAEHENLVERLKVHGFWIYLERSRERSYIWTEALYATKDVFRSKHVSTTT
jgi:hypothetical protein